jgi:hypothetical protein
MQELKKNICCPNWLRAGQEIQIPAACAME